jgi:glutamate synthase domain-containing protein 3
VADRYWNARGGSFNDGGSFSFTVKKASPDAPYGSFRELTCANKFGEEISAPTDQVNYIPNGSQPAASAFAQKISGLLTDRTRPINYSFENLIDPIFPLLQEWLVVADFDEIKSAIQYWVNAALRNGHDTMVILALLSRIRDRIYDPGSKRRASILAMLDDGIVRLLSAVPLFDANQPQFIARFNWENRETLAAPATRNATLVLDVDQFPPEGDEGPGLFLSQASRLGWHHLVSYGWRGQRFLACNLGPVSERLRFDAYGSPGDYLASGLDGDKVMVVVHNNAQDQLAQIFNHGTLVVYGDVGQTFMYGAKGGKAFIRGNAAGRPLINAVGSPRVVINGTCLDYLAESFMAGNPLNGGGFVIVNGIEYDEHGKLHPLADPYPGGNLFSLASGGAIYIRDPHNKVTEDQLNGGFFQPVTQADVDLITPYLKENEQHFGIPLASLLTVDGKVCKLEEVYRKVGAGAVVALH